MSFVAKSDVPERPFHICDFKYHVAAGMLQVSEVEGEDDADHTEHPGRHL